jgi:hypothetical protein
VWGADVADMARYERLCACWGLKRLKETHLELLKQQQVLRH